MMYCNKRKGFTQIQHANHEVNCISVSDYNLTATKQGRAMAEAVSRRPLTAEARVRSPVSPSGICGGQSGTGTGFSPSTSVFPCQFHSTGAPLHGKTKKINHLHHRVAQ
jgi:hypothetical protein